MKLSAKQKALIVLALVLPLIYKGLNALFYQLILSDAFLSVLPMVARQYLGANFFMLDAVFCIFMICIAAPIFFAVRKQLTPKDPVKTVSYSAKQFPALLVIAMGAGGITTIWQFVARLFLANSSVMAESISSFDATFTSQPGPSAWIWSFISIAIAGPIVEELIFRGILMRALNTKLSGVWAIIISALYFGLWHSMPIQIVYTAVLGAILGIAYYTTNNLWFPMLIHLINNISSALPDSLMNNETFALGLIIVKVVAIIPAIILLVKMWRAKKSEIA